MHYWTILVGFICLLLLGTPTFAAYCTGGPDEGERQNKFPIYKTDMRLKQTAINAVLYEAGPENATFPILHVYGTPYEMGYAQGKVMQRYMKEFISKTWNYLMNMIADEMDDRNVSPLAKKIIAERGMEKALEWTASVTAEFTPESFYEELRGIADGSGIDYNILLYVNLFPELTKAHCSFFGAWDTATTDKGTFQLRALDYDVVGPFKDYPQVTVYHHSAESVTGSENLNSQHTFASVTWPGCVGVLTGFSVEQIGVSEIGVSNPDDSFGQGTEDTPPDKVHGQPWMSVARDILEQTASLDEAIAYVEAANRTCNLVVGIGDGEQGLVNGIEYSGYVAIPYDDETLLPESEVWHPKIPDVVYNGMDWDCPGWDLKLGTQLQKYHGSIDPSVTIHNILPTVQTGNLHIAVYDLTQSLMYVSFCRRSASAETEPLNAYERQFILLDMHSIFSEPKPEAE